MSEIQIQRAIGSNIFADLKSEWTELYSKSKCAPFSSWEWLSVWHSNFGNKKEPYILKAFRDNQLVGILPLFIEQKSFFGFKISRVGLIGEKHGGADYLDLITDETDCEQIATAFAEFLVSEKGFEQISFEYVDKHSIIALILQKMAKLNSKWKARYSVSRSTNSPLVNLSGNPDELLKQSRRYTNYKRRLNQLQKIDGFEFRTITFVEETEAAFERFYYLHEKRWAESGGSELSGHPKLLSFQRDLISNLTAADLLCFNELWIEGKCRASVYGLQNGDVFYYYNAGYDLEWAKKSVGLVLIGLSIKNAAERGIKTYDFLRGDEVYKFDWANEKNELLNIEINRPTIAVKAENGICESLSLVNRLAKSLLPQGFGEKLLGLCRKFKRNYQLSTVNTE